MKKKLLLVFFIIILMPITVITVMAFYSYRDSEKRELENQKNIATDILLLNDRVIKNAISLVEQELDQIELESSDTPDEIRRSTSGIKLVKQAFLINELNTFTFPPENDPKSAKEVEFINEAEKIELISSLQIPIGSSEQNESISQWYTWFMGDGINFIYYSNKGREIKGYLIERYALVSELINVLPQADPDDGNFKIELRDARGDLLYQWGSYKYENNEEPIREFSLSEPLGSWRFFYYLDFGNNIKIINNRNIISYLGIPIMTIMIILLSVYFYRENSREMKIARQQVSFVNQVSHELKTPLTNIRLYSELLENKIKDRKQLSFLKIIINESSRLGRMINNVLTFSKGERGELKSNMSYTDVNQLIIQVLDKFRPLLKENQMEIHYSEIEIPLLKTDGDMIEQILINLVSNAVKYGSSGKYLGIETAKLNNRLILKVVDRGPGIADSEKDKIFKAFYRIDDSLSQQNSGTGIGLSIAAKLAEETGSELKLEKNSQGMIFSLSIPWEQKDENSDS